MAAPGGFSYKPNVNRAVTKKWREANQVNYDGDDWAGDDDYGYEEPPAPVSAGNGRHPAWGAQGSMYPSNRSVTNPSPSRGGGRTSFDRGDEKRYVSSGGGGFESAYPTTQRAPFPEPQHDAPPQNFWPQPPLQLYTQGHGPYPPPSFRPSSRGQQFPQHPNAPFSAPAGYPDRRSESGTRSNQGDMYKRHESPVRPDSRASSNSARQFPPRKTSLSQQQPPSDVPGTAADSAGTPHTATPPTGETKALPFIRPADIYKRVEEEREKERRSQESSRPSLDLNTSRTRDSSTSARSATPESKDTSTAVAEDTDSTRRLKPTLDTVVERKSEYGFDNILLKADGKQSAAQTQDSSVNRHPTNASSIYTDRPDPVSASTASREDSPRHADGQEEPYSASSSYQFNLPSLGKISSFGSDLGSSITPAVTADVAEPDRPPLPAPVKESQLPTGSTAADLSHKPSLGYRSVVEQAFDQSQQQNPLSPTSVDDTLPRSNSASTSDISPIMSRRADNSQGPSGPPLTEQTIPEEPSSSSDSRPLSDSTMKAEGLVHERPFPPASVIQAGYRRDHTPPRREESPAKQPLSIQTANQPQPTQGIFSTTESESVTARILDENEESTRGRTGRSPPGSSTGPNPSSVLMSPQSNHSTTSDEYKDWQNQRKQFNARFGYQDSNPTTPGVPSPVSRSETPPKGSVKDLAEKYETHSGRQTPVNNPAADPVYGVDSRPPPQPRQESFRPSIPGGWQSSSATPRLQTPTQDSTKTSQAPRLAAQTRFESTESIPTAKAPQDWREEREGPSRSAFAAAAAAGTALAGAFSGPALSERARDEAQEDSEDSWERSAASSEHAPESFDARDFSTSEEAKTNLPAPSNEASLPPTPFPKDTPLASQQPQNVTTSVEKDGLEDLDQEQPTADYFPAPLRTSRSVDANEIMRPPIPIVHHADEPTIHKNNEQLQQEIVKSLTPKSSNVEVHADEASANQPLATSSARGAAETSNVYDSFGQKPVPEPTPSRVIEPDETGLDSRSTQPLPEDTSNGGPPSPPRRPFLEQRFSWEMEPEGPPTSTLPMKQPMNEPVASTPSKIPSPSTQSPDTIRAPERLSSEAPITEPQQMTSPISASTTRPISDAEEATVPPPVLKDTTPAMTVPKMPGLADRLPFRKILALENHEQRIKAFNDSRDSYGQSDGMLDQWILSMQSPEYAEIFQSNGQIMQSAASGSSTTPRPSTNRSLPNISGSKLMQQDGKKLMEKAGRFGGKAGVAAKGLFAKGKDKLRSASAGDKGFLTSRRKSTGPDLLEPKESESSKPDSAFLTAPPQIPAQDLQSSPIDAGVWFGSERESKDTDAVGPAITATESRHLPPVLLGESLDPARSRKDSLARSRSPSISVPSRSSTPHNEQGNQETRIADQDHASSPVQAASSLLATKESEDTSGVAEAQDRLASSRAEEDTVKKEQASTPNAVPTVAVPTTPGTSGHNVTGNEQTLAVPEQRPHSVISNVSSASPSPATSHEGQNIQRSVSPAEPAESHDEAVPSYHPRMPTKEDEAVVDRQAAETQGADDPVPSYDKAPASSNDARGARIGPDAQIVPIADLSRQRRQEEIRTSERPFSFDGTEYLNRVAQASESRDNGPNPPSLPLSPISQTMSKSISQVSDEEVTDGPMGAPGKKQSRSYSRPFGGDPIRDHPALRQPDQAIDRSRIYSTESPLPSARRPQEDFDNIRRPTPPVVETEEEGEYRIPGPHFQELRSPRRSSAQNNLPAVQQFRQANSQQQTNGIGQYPQQQQQQQQPQIQPPQPQPQPPPPQQVMRPPPQQVGSSVKKPKFGGLFQSRSKPRPGIETKENEPVIDDRAGSRQRNKLFRRDSRQDSIASQQSGTNEKRDVVGQLPPTDKSKRRSSRDLMRSPTPTDQGEGRKKRFSAMGNLFSRGSKAERMVPPQRSSTLPLSSSQPHRNNLPGTHPQQHSYGRAVPPTGQFYHPQQLPQFQGSPPPPGGYYAPAHQQQQHASPWAQYPQQYPYTQQPPALRPGEGLDGRPSDLRIDTTGDGRIAPAAPMPATAPPSTHTSRDMSYSTRSYEPTTAKVQSPPVLPPASRGHDSHVVDLHKRSRSPKLGRRSSGEEQVARESRDGGTPVDNLGTFSNKKMSPVGGIPRPEQDQEAPYRIDIPGEPSEEEKRRRTRQLLIEQGGIKDAQAQAATSPTTGRTVAERMTGPQVPASKAAQSPVQQQMSGNVNGGKAYVAELPGSKAEGYESDEEVQMSATAYPGNWQDPIFFGDGKWED